VKSEKPEKDRDRERAEAMAVRLRRTAGRFALSGANLDSLDECFRYVVGLRLQAWPEPHPDFLHPARTALILLDDVGIADVAALGSGLLYDSDRPDLSVSASDAAALGWNGAADLLAQFPPAGLDDSRLMESLVTLDPVPLAVVLSERLDHARHLHFRPADRWQSSYRQVLDIYLPIAVRSSILAARFDAWAEAFSRRLMRRPIGGNS
jgi:hypothetical protein